MVDVICPSVGSSVSGTLNWDDKAKSGIDFSTIHNFLFVILDARSYTL